MTKLQHEEAEDSSSWVTVHYDGRMKNLRVDDKGTVEVENQQELKELEDNHGKFFKLDEDDQPDHVLADKTVSEVEEYVSKIENEERLKELRSLEDRKTGKEVIDERIGELKEEQKESEPENSVDTQGNEAEEAEEKEDKSDDEIEENSQEDGEETENE